MKAQRRTGPPSRFRCDAQAPSRMSGPPNLSLRRNVPQSKAAVAHESTRLAPHGPGAFADARGADAAWHDSSLAASRACGARFAASDWQPIPPRTLTAAPSWLRTRPPSGSARAALAKQGWHAFRSRAAKFPADAGRRVRKSIFGWPRLPGRSQARPQQRAVGAHLSAARIQVPGVPDRGPGRGVACSIE
jgi:hypothetical protein